MLNLAVIMGRLVATPELKQTQSGIAVTTFTVAVQRSFAGTNGEKQTDFINVVAWRNQAEFVSKYFQKGQMIALRGSIQTRSYEDKTGQKRTDVEIVANEISFFGEKNEETENKRNLDFAKAMFDSDDEDENLPF